MASRGEYRPAFVIVPQRWDRCDCRNSHAQQQARSAFAWFQERKTPHANARRAQRTSRESRKNPIGKLCWTSGQQRISAFQKRIRRSRSLRLSQCTPCLRGATLSRSTLLQRNGITTEKLKHGEIASEPAGAKCLHVIPEKSTSTPSESGPESEGAGQKREFAKLILARLGQSYMKQNLR